MSTRPIRACMMAYTFYENDGRVMRYAEALARDGAHVDVVSLKREGQSDKEVINGVHVTRIQRRTKNEKGKMQYLFRLLKFFVLSMAHITMRHLRTPYDVIHVHSVPDFEIFAAIVPKLCGAKLILDIHDIVPEFYAAKFNISATSLTFSALKLVEKWSARFADHVIIANHLWLMKLTHRAVGEAKCSAYINYPDVTIFFPSLRTRRSGDPFILIYPGTLNWHQGLDIAIQAFALAVQRAPDIQFHIYGEGSAKPNLRKLIDDLHLTGKVFLHPPLPLREIATVMANADLGVVPKRNDSFGGDAFSTKVLEFMALGVPVVVSETRIDRHYFDESLVRFFTPGDHQCLADKMVDAYRDRATNARLAERALDYARQNSWNEKQQDYLALVERLVHARA